jgi:hypothetical protein
MDTNTSLLLIIADLNAQVHALIAEKTQLLAENASLLQQVNASGSEDDGGE